MKHVIAAILGASLLTGPVFAQTPASPAQTPGQSQNQGQGQGQPIEITATKTVEWLRDQQQYVARENVIVTQGAMTIMSDLLTADYRDGATSSQEIWQLTAEGNVQIKDEANTAYGDRGVYDVPKGIATLTGENLRLVSPDQTVTARDRMEYHSNERLAKAIGNAKVVRAQDTLSADVITAYFKDDAAQSTAQEVQAAASVPSRQGSTASAPASPLGGSGGNLDRLEADGNVVIKTPTETLYGRKGVYRAETNTAELTGKVRIERGPNVLEGERAVVDLNTNVSKMYGAEKDGGRVRGVFFPGTNKKTEGQDKSPVPAPFKQSPAPGPEKTLDQTGVAPGTAPPPAPALSTENTAPDLFPESSPSEKSPTAPAGGDAKVSPQ